uniref:Robin n=1 Tax=Moumouvirus sp. 'Monve' TaxID=1128131 RepID=H2EEJ4_9VIRU|nr:robin [Moumouvirus Monve]
MKYFTFTNNLLRTYVDNIIYSFKYINKPINDENIFINIDFGPQELNKLAILIPNVKNLNLYFGDITVKYDLSPLIQLKNIKTLIINSLKQEKFLPRLLNIKSLKVLNLSKLIIYGQTLDPIEPIFLWPKIKNTKFLHINKIERYHDVINYDIKKQKYSQILFQKILF